MFKEFLESSRKYKARFKELRMQALTLCVYNLLVAYIITHQKELVWNYGLVGSVYRDKIGLQTTFPIITSKFGFTSGFINFVFSILMSFPVIVTTRKLRNYLLPGLLWNMYFLTSHSINIIEICYDIITLTPGFYSSFMILTAAAFLIAIQIMLFLDTISYYDLLNMKTPQMEDVTLEEIEECFGFSQSPWLLIENEYLMRGINIYKKEADFLPSDPAIDEDNIDTDSLGNDEWGRMSFESLTKRNSTEPNEL